MQSKADEQIIEGSNKRRFFARSIVGGVPVDVCDEAQLVNVMVSVALQEHGKERSPRTVFDVNGQGLALALTNPEYRNSILQADVVHADGQPLIFASKIFCERPIPARTATTDLIHAVGRALENSELTVYFLGATAATVEKAALKFRGLYPNSRLVGFHHGYFRRDELPSVIAKINSLRPDFIFIGLGKPLEQLLSIEIKDTLQASWLITAGGCFDFLAGSKPRAPKWMQAIAFEWAFRLAQEPRRLLWRYFWTNIVAVAVLLVRTERRSPGLTSKEQETPIKAPSEEIKLD